MKKVIALKDLDCANCAMKMEQGIKKIPGVHEASVNFMFQKMTLVVDDENSDKILEEVRAVCKKIEPDCQLKI